jgi:hypothetical protein
MDQVLQYQIIIGILVALRIVEWLYHYHKTTKKLIKESKEQSEKLKGIIGGEPVTPRPNPPKDSQIIKEGKVKKGGVNEKPTIPRPPAPKGQGGSSMLICPCINKNVKEN